MKKVCVVTWHQGPNYGTVLQALALQHFLNNRGYDSYLMNYNVPTPIKKKKNFNLKNKVSRLIIKLFRVIYKNRIAKKEKEFKDIIINNCKMTKFVHNDQEYIETCNSFDTVIYGSDQIWNPNWYHPYYYGNYDSISTRLISYASSFGVYDILDENQEIISKAINRFDNISVREKNGKDIIKKLIHKDCKMVVDPTLLIDKMSWSKFCINDKTPKCEYILCYMLSDNNNHWSAIKKFAKSTKLPIYIIPYEGFSYFQSKNIVIGANVGNFLDLIRNAKYIITDSFHGSIFSIIFEKNFILFERHNSNNYNSQNSRLYNLLEIVGLDNRIIKHNSKKIDNCSNIDYTKVNSNLDELIKNSREYIIDSIEK